MHIKPYKIAIPQTDVDDLKRRLNDARWPNRTRSGQGWTRGVPPDYLQNLVDYWRSGFDWRRQEAALNTLDQFTAEIDGQSIHFFHVMSEQPNAMPLLLAHGWPSSGVEFSKLVGPLTDPAAHGGRPEHAFHVVVPTIPGFGLSSPVVEDWDAIRTARAYSAIMRALGYDRYGAHGGDIGADVIGEINHVDKHLVGVHASTDMASILWYAKFTGVDPTAIPQLSEADKSDLQRMIDRGAEGGGYLEIQKTRPLTIGYLLNDSPLGQLAWIVEKIQAWTAEQHLLPEHAVDLDQMLTNISLYWFTKSGASAADFICNNLHAQRDWGAPSLAPVGMACFGARPAARAIMDPEHQTKHWSEFAAGGHFPAMEQPDLLAADLRTFFAEFRAPLSAT